MLRATASVVGLCAAFVFVLYVVYSRDTVPTPESSPTSTQPPAQEPHLKAPPPTGKLLLLPGGAAQPPFESTGYLVESDGNAHQVGFGFSGGAWSPDGQLGIFGCRVLNWKGEEQFHLRADSAIDCITPLWSPDGRAIAYTLSKYSSFPNVLYQISLANRDGSHTETLTAEPGNYQLFGWSPDGRRLLLGQAPLPPSNVGLGPVGEGYTLFTVDTRGNETALPRPEGVHIIDAKWSPNGRYIAFTSGEGNTGFELWAMNADGSNPRPLACLDYFNGDASLFPQAAQTCIAAGLVGATGACDIQGEKGGWFAWSPDGSRVLYTRDSSSTPNSPPDSPGTSTSSFHVMNVETGEDTKLADCAKGANLGINYFGWLPSWSPSGNSILVGFPDGGVYVYDARGESRTKIGEGGFPVWSPAGEYVAFLGRDGNVYSVRPDGSELTQLTDDGFRFFPVAWLPTLGSHPRVFVEPSAGPVGTTVTVSGIGFVAGGGYPAVLAPFDKVSPKPDRPPEGFPVPIPGGFPESSHPRGNGCELGTASAGSNGSFSMTVTIPEHCTTLDGDPATVLPGTYMIWDTGNGWPPLSAWFSVTQ